jgi:hypothetical protein
MGHGQKYHIRQVVSCLLFEFIITNECPHCLLNGTPNGTYILELLGGFGSHTNSLEANKLRAKYKALSLKEEADSSHINQALANEQGQVFSQPELGGPVPCPLRSCCRL